MPVMSGATNAKCYPMGGYNDKGEYSADHMKGKEMMGEMAKEGVKEMEKGDMSAMMKDGMQGP